MSSHHAWHVAVTTWYELPHKHARARTFYVMSNGQVVSRVIEITLQEFYDGSDIVLLENTRAREAWLEIFAELQNGAL